MDIIGLTTISSGDGPKETMNRLESAVRARGMTIDLPLKALVWSDSSGKTWLSWNDPDWLARRHGLGLQGEAAVAGS